MLKPKYPPPDGWEWCSMEDAYPMGKDTQNNQLFAMAGAACIFSATKTAGLLQRDSCFVKPIKNGV